MCPQVRFVSQPAIWGFDQVGDRLCSTEAPAWTWPCQRFQLARHTARSTALGELSSNSFCPKYTMVLSCSVILLGGMLFPCATQLYIAAYIAAVTFGSAAHACIDGVVIASAAVPAAYQMWLRWLCRILQNNQAFILPFMCLPCTCRSPPPCLPAAWEMCRQSCSGATPG